MKRSLRLLSALGLATIGFLSQSNAQTTTFSTPGTYAFTSPVGVISYNVDMTGGKGGNSSWAPGPGGSGGRVQCVLAVTAGEVLNVVVGGAGTAGVAGTTVAGGYNNTSAVGGYCSSIPAYGGGGGGGSSEICVGGTALTNRVVVAGAGGGGGSNCSPNAGGNGGGTTGASAISCSTEYSGTGGTPSTGGLGGTYNPYGTSANGTARYGGAASTYPSATVGSAGGGGGGGYYGGGGGSWGGGGGGSSYTDPVSVTGAVHTQGYNSTGDGMVKLTYVCETPVAGTITGNAPVCTGGSTLTLADPTGSSYGVWSSSNTAVATVGSSTGVVTSGVSGTATISFTATTACGTTATTTVNVTVTPLPSAGTITGTANACPTQTVTLTDAVSGGLWSSSATTIATVNASTGVVTAVAAGAATISYTVTISGCTNSATFPFTVNPPSICNAGVPVAGTGAADLILYPNPVGKVLNISSGTQIQSVSIANLLGQLIYTSSFHENNVDIDVSGLVPGVYLVRVNGTEVRKFIRE